MTWTAPDVDIVGVAELAHRFGVKPNTVEKWRQRSADPDHGFVEVPEPVGYISGVPWWHWHPWQIWGIRTARLELGTRL